MFETLQEIQEACGKPYEALYFGTPCHLWLGPDVKEIFPARIQKNSRHLEENQGRPRSLLFFFLVSCTLDLSQTSADIVIDTGLNDSQGSKHH